MTEPKIVVSGCRRDLSDGREVFVGHAGDGDTYYVRFKNAEGGHTKLKLSPAAFEALIEMKNACDRKGEPYWIVKNETSGRNEDWQKA